MVSLVPHTNLLLLLLQRSTLTLKHVTPFNQLSSLSDFQNFLKTAPSYPCPLPQNLLKFSNPWLLKFSNPWLLKRGDAQCESVISFPSEQ